MNRDVKKIVFMLGVSAYLIPSDEVMSVKFSAAELQRAKSDWARVLQGQQAAAAQQQAAAAAAAAAAKAAAERAEAERERVARAAADAAAEAKKRDDAAITIERVARGMAARKVAAAEKARRAEIDAAIAEAFAPFRDDLDAHEEKLRVLQANIDTALAERNAAEGRAQEEWERAEAIVRQEAEFAVQKEVAAEKDDRLPGNLEWSVVEKNKKRADADNRGISFDSRKTAAQEALTAAQTITSEFQHRIDEYEALAGKGAALMHEAQEPRRNAELAEDEADAADRKMQRYFSRKAQALSEKADILGQVVEAVALNTTYPEEVLAYVQQKYNEAEAARAVFAVPAARVRPDVAAIAEAARRIPDHIFHCEGRRAEFEDQLMAAQADVDGIKALHASLEKKIKAAEPIKRAYKAYQARKKEEAKALERQKVVVKLQSAARGFLARKRAKIEKKAVVTAQSLVRGFFARKHVEALRAEAAAEAVRVAEAAAARAKFREEYQELETLAMGAETHANGENAKTTDVLVEKDNDIKTALTAMNPELERHQSAFKQRERAIIAVKDDLVGQKDTLLSTWEKLGKAVTREAAEGFATVLTAAKAQYEAAVAQAEEALENPFPQFAERLHTLQAAVRKGVQAWDDFLAAQMPLYTTAVEAWNAVAAKLNEREDRKDSKQEAMEKAAAMQARGEELSDLVGKKQVALTQAYEEMNEKLSHAQSVHASAHNVQAGLRDFLSSLGFMRDLNVTALVAAAAEREEEIKAFRARVGEFKTAAEAYATEFAQKLAAGRKAVEDLFADPDLTKNVGIIAGLPAKFKETEIRVTEAVSCIKKTDTEGLLKRLKGAKTPQSAATFQKGLRDALSSYNALAQITLSDEGLSKLDAAIAAAQAKYGVAVDQLRSTISGYAADVLEKWSAHLKGAPKGLEGKLDSEQEALRAAIASYSGIQFDIASAEAEMQDYHQQMLAITGLRDAASEAYRSATKALAEAQERLQQGDLAYVGAINVSELDDLVKAASLRSPTPSPAGTPERSLGGSNSLLRGLSGLLRDLAGSPIGQQVTSMVRRLSLSPQTFEGSPASPTTHLTAHTAALDVLREAAEETKLSPAAARELSPDAATLVSPPLSPIPLEMSTPGSVRGTPQDDSYRSGRGVATPPSGASGTPLNDSYRPGMGVLTPESDVSGTPQDDRFIPGRAVVTPPSENSEDRSSVSTKSKRSRRSRGARRDLSGVLDTE